MKELKDHWLVLIVEDDPDDAEMLSEALRPPKNLDSEVVDRMGLAVRRIYATDKKPIDALLLDLRLPNGEGEEVVINFQKLFPGIPMVVITGMDVDPARIIRLGVHDVIRKDSLEHSMPDLIPRVVYKAIARHEVRADFKPIYDDLEAHDNALVEVCQSLKAPETMRPIVLK